MAAKQVMSKYDGTNSQFLARKYGYSQKWVMKVIHQANTQKKGDSKE
ncbi:Mor transcription activator family protein [Liquorilactobacillus aquaticus]|nr:Mor transcription activator family protein [Liquorilactobacillus aquaticus]